MRLMMELVELMTAQFLESYSSITMHLKLHSGIQFDLPVVRQVCGRQFPIVCLSSKTPCIVQTTQPHLILHSQLHCCSIYLRNPKSPGLSLLNRSVKSHLLLPRSVPQNKVYIVFRIAGQETQNQAGPLERNPLFSYRAPPNNLVELGFLILSELLTWQHSLTYFYWAIPFTVSSPFHSYIFMQCVISVPNVELK